MGGTVRVVKKHLITSARGKLMGKGRTSMSHITTEDPALYACPLKRNSLTVLATWPLTPAGYRYALSFEVLYRRSGAAGTYGGIIFLISKFFTAFTDWVPALCWIPDARSVQKVSSVFYSVCVIPGHLTGDRQLCRPPFDVTGKTVMATILFMLYGCFSA